jgi:hypothetical protein
MRRIAALSTLAPSSVTYQNCETTLTITARKRRYLNSRKHILGMERFTLKFFRM